MNTDSIRDAIARGSHSRVGVFGSVLNYLPPTQITQCLDFHDTDDFNSPFELISDQPETFTKTSRAYLAMYSHLMDVLPKPVLAQVLFPHFPDQCGYVLSEAIDKQLPEILVGYINLWNRIHELDLAQFYNPIYERLGSTLVEALSDSFSANQTGVAIFGLVAEASVETIYLVRQLFAALKFTDNLDAYQAWSISEEYDDMSAVDFFFDLFKKGREEEIDEYIKLLKPVAAHPEASAHLDELEAARTKYRTWKSALNDLKLTNLAKRLITTSKTVAHSPLQLKR